MKKSVNCVRVFNADGRCTYEANFSTAAAAHKDYEETVRSARRFANESGKRFTICRYSEDRLMCLAEIG